MHVKVLAALEEFIFLVSKITEDGDCSHEIKRCLLLRRKTVTNLDSILSHKGSPRILKWVAFPFSRGSSQLRDQT